MNSAGRKRFVGERLALGTIALASTLALAACGGSDAGASAAGINSGAAGQSGDSGGAAASGEVLFTSGVADFATRDRVEGIEICVLDADPAVCTKTDATGKFELPVPANSKVAITATADAYVPEIFQLESGGEDFTRHGYVIPKEDLSTQLLAAIGQAFDPTKGQFSFNVDSADVSYEIDPPSGEEPFFLVGASITAGDPATPSTGFTGIINVDPGEVTLTVSHPTKTCETTGGWPIEPGVETVVIRAGFLTAMSDHECN